MIRPSSGRRLGTADWRCGRCPARAWRPCGGHHWQLCQFRRSSGLRRGPDHPTLLEVQSMSEARLHGRRADYRRVFRNIIPRGVQVLKMRPRLGILENNAQLSAMIFSSYFTMPVLPFFRFILSRFVSMPGSSHCRSCRHRRWPSFSGLALLALAKNSVCESAT
jgi:hypothetical protein